MSDFDFQPYRDFILRDGDKQRALYTPTDALLPLQVGMIAQRESGESESSPEKRVEQLPVLEGLRKYALGSQREHVILAGRPGSGKSTALQQLRLALAAEGLVPVLVQLKGDRSVPEMIQGEFRRGKQKVSLEQIDDWLLADQLVLLLDGVNEMPTDDLRRDLMDFREQNATVPMIFTTRDLAVGGDLGIKQRLEMKPLTELQMREFVGQRLPVEGEKLLGQLGDRLREIAETPLLLKMLCDVFGQTGQVPENKGELFRLFDREYDKFKLLPPVSEDFRRFKSEILQHLAFVMMTGDSSRPTEFWLTIDKGSAEREIKKFLIDNHERNPASKAKEWLEDLLEYHLLQIAADINSIEFHHQLFQEYYAAKKLVGMFHDSHPDVIDNKRFQHFYLNYLKWTEVIGFAVSLIDHEDLATEIVELALGVDLTLGAKLVSQLHLNFQTIAIKTIYSKEIPTWFKIYLLGCTGSVKATKILLDFLKNDDLDSAINSVSALKSFNDIEAVPALQEKLNNLEKWVSVGNSNLNSYGVEPGDKTLSPKAERLEVEILQVLLKLSPESVKPKINEYINNPSSCMDYLTIRPEINDAIILYARQSREDIEKQLLSLLERTNNANRINQLASILARLNSKDAIKVLIEKIKDNCDNQSLKAIINALSDFDDEKASEALVMLVEHSDFFIRCDAAKVIGNDRRMDAIPYLQRILKNSDFYIRWQAAMVLAEFGMDTACELLAEGLEHENHEVREKSVKSLNNLTSTKKKDILMNKLSDQSYFVRRRAAIVLADSGYEEAIPELLKALFNYRPKDSNIDNAYVDFYWQERGQTHRIDGFNTLEVLGDDVAIKQWIDEQVPCIRRGNNYKIIAALSSFQSKIVQEKLYTSLSLGNKIAALALAKFGDIDMAKHLVEILKSDYHEPHSSQACELLASLINCAQESDRNSLIQSIISDFGNPGEHEHYHLRNRLAIVLIRIDSQYTAKYLSDLRLLLNTDVGELSLWVIESIQEKCRFYNHEIYSLSTIQPLPEREMFPGSTTIYSPEVKIIEKIQNYYESSQNST